MRSLENANEAALAEPRGISLEDHSLGRCQEGSESLCVCCLESLNNRVICLPCSHRFHENCIDKWSIKQRGVEAEHHLNPSMDNATCPTCRAPFTGLPLIDYGPLEHRLVGNKHTDDASFARQWPMLEARSSNPNLGAEVCDVNLGKSAISDTTIIAIAERCPGLQSIRMGGDMAITDAALFVLAEHCSWIRSINIYGNSRITDDGVVALVMASGNTLRSIELGSCDRISDVSVRALAENCSAVNFLGLTCQLDGKSDEIMTRYSDAALAQVARRCARLKSVDLCSTYVTEETLKLFLNTCEELLYVDISGTDVSGESETVRRMQHRGIAVVIDASLNSFRVDVVKPNLMNLVFSYPRSV